MRATGRDGEGFPAWAEGEKDRALINEAGTEVFQTALVHGWIDESDPAFAPGTTNRSALELLTELGLLRYDEQGMRYHPVDPSAAGDQHVVPLAQRGSELLAESAAWNNTFSRLGQIYRASETSRHRSITEVHGIEAINSFIDAQLNDCRIEMLFAQPHGRRRPATLAQAEQRDLRALARGVRMRTLYQHSARHSQATREYVEEVGALGAEVRTLDEFFGRLMIFDRHTALIPATENHMVAVAIHDKSVVAYLRDIFNRAWERALPFTLTGDLVARTVAKDVRRLTLRMLVDGYSDSVSAKRLGVSARTYASYIAALKEEYGVQTRFQLGWAMSQTQDGKVDPPSDSDTHEDESPF